MLKYKRRPKFEWRIKMDLAVELTGKNEEAIKKQMDRTGCGFAEIINYYGLYEKSK